MATDKNGIFILPLSKSQKRARRRRKHKKKREEKNQIISPFYNIIYLQSRQLYALQNGKCFYCQNDMMEYGYSLYNPLGYTRDHFFSRYHGFEKLKGNMVLACRACNVKKGNTLPTEKHIHQFQELYKKGLQINEYYISETQFCPCDGCRDQSGRHRPTVLFGELWRCASGSSIFNGESEEGYQTFYCHYGASVAWGGMDTYTTALSD